MALLGDGVTYTELGQGSVEASLSVPFNLCCVSSPSPKTPLFLPHICMSVGTAPEETHPAGESLHLALGTGLSALSAGFL